MLNEEVELFIEEMKENSNKCLNHLQSEFFNVRAGRANPRILDKILVSYYGSPTPLNQVANITVPEARILAISPWDASVRNEIIRAINMSEIGISPNDDGKVIRLIFPALTEERRKDLCKEIKKMAEETKVALRNERRNCLDGCKKLKNDKVITEDELAVCEKDVQKVLDDLIVKVDSMLEQKEKEILTI